MEREIHDLDKQFGQIYNLIKEVLTFKKDFNMPLIAEAKNSIVDIEPIFLSKLENYLQIHLIPIINKETQNNPEKIGVVFKQLLKMTTHLHNFARLVGDGRSESGDLKLEISSLIKTSIGGQTNLLDIEQEVVGTFWTDYNNQVTKALTNKINSNSLQNNSSDIGYILERVTSYKNSHLNRQDANLIIKFFSSIEISGEKMERALLDFVNELGLVFVSSVFGDVQLAGRPILKLIDIFFKTYIVGFVEWFCSEFRFRHNKKEELVSIASETFNRLIVRELSLRLFDYVFDYDVYSNRLIEMKTIINSKENLTEFTEPIFKDIQTKLLTVSLSTKKIITFYINLLKFWGNVNKNYKILQKLTTSIKTYFLGRKDALRFILDIWIAEVRENSKRASQRKEDNFLINVPAEGNEYASEDEQSDFDFVVEREKKNVDKFKFRRSDVKTLLIDLYGSREKFLLEYENFIAEKILKFEIEDVQEEFDNLNFLKSQIKNAEYKSKCDILMSDLEYSKSITKEFHQVVPEYDKYELVVLSKTFWPVNYETRDFDASECHYLKFLDHFNEFHLSYTKNRKVNFHNNIGEVELEISCNGSSIEVKCQPINAVLLTEIQEAGKFGVSLKELSDKLKTDIAYIKRKMQFWLSKKIVKAEQQGNVQSRSLAQLDDYEDKQSIAIMDKEESLIYLLNEDFQPTDEIIVNEEDYNEQITVRESGETEGGEKSTGNIEGYILNILSKSGVKPINKLFDLLKHIYKNDIPRTFDVKSLQKLVNKMLKRKVLMKRGQMYYVVN